MKQFSSLACIALASLFTLGLSSDCHGQTASGSTQKPASAADKIQSGAATSGQATTESPAVATAKLETATFGGGCFWCTEAVFLRLKGVVSVQSGYMGGHVENPTYKEVCEKTTGHVEVIQIKFDPTKIRFDDLLAVHLKTHDPTSWDRQGYDIGPQYRSAVFSHNDVQQKKTEAYKKKLNEQLVFGKPIVTEVKPATKFWVAEDYHQNYFANNPNSGYCRALIPKKLAKLKAIFADKLKQPNDKPDQ